MSDDKGNPELAAGKVAGLNAQVKALEKEAERLRAERNSAREESAHLNQMLEAKVKELKTVQTQMSLLKNSPSQATAQALTAERDSLAHECELLKQQLDGANQERESLAQVHQLLEQDCQKVIADRDVLERDYDLILKDRDALALERDAKTAELMKARLEVARLTAELEKSTWGEVAYILVYLSVPRPKYTKMYATSPQVH